MIRGLRYWIQFATSNELTLVHEMTLDEDHAEGMRESFAIEGDGVHGADFTPAQMALLHCAILEMKRMRTQNLEALTDGESVGMVERAVAREDGEQPDPAPDEGERDAAALTADEADLVSVADIKLLGMLSEGVTLKMGHPALSRFRNRGWVEVTAETGAFPTSEREYGITNAGRRALAAQTPEAESVTTPPLTEEELRLLTAMRTGEELHYNAEDNRPWLGKGLASDIVPWDMFMGLLKARMLDIARPAENRTAHYMITNAGRRALAAQTPEAEREPALDSDQRWILSHMTDGSMLVWDPTVGDGQTVTIENGHSTLTKHELDLLHDAGYIAYDADQSGGAGPKRYYAIADKGRRVLAAQVPS